MFNVNDTEGRAQLLYAPVVVRGIGMCVYIVNAHSRTRVFNMYEHV